MASNLSRAANLLRPLYPRSNFSSPKRWTIWKVPGLAIAVVQNGEMALVRAYGLRDVEAGLPVTTDTQFLIGSATKSFTSTGLALLVDERRLDWKKPVRDYIPEFRLQDAVATDRGTV